MVYREKTLESASYKFCYAVSPDLGGRVFGPDYFSYGYQIYGTGHNYIQK